MPEIPIGIASLDLEFLKWLIPVVGAASTGFALAVGFALLGRRRKNMLPPKDKGLSAAQKDPFVHGSSGEKRAALRRNGNPVSILLTDAELQKKPVQAWVVDRSTGGLCVAVPNQVEKGTILSVRAVNSPKEVPWYQIVVRSCRQFEETWEIGCEFVKAPPWSVLLLFG